MHILYAVALTLTTLCPTSGSFGDSSFMEGLHHIEPLTSDKAVGAYCMPLHGELGGSWNLLSIIISNLVEYIIRCKSYSTCTCIH